MAARRRLDVQIFNIQLLEGRDAFDTDSAALDWLETLKFKVIPRRVFRTGQEILDWIHGIGDDRDQFTFDIDGACVKLDNLTARAEFGSTAKFPRWAAAYKYPPEQKPSVVQDIVIQVGRTGVLTPKANLSPVRLAGTTVTNATLHNQDFISEKDIRIGDTVIVQKAGKLFRRSSLSCRKNVRRSTALSYPGSLSGLRCAGAPGSGRRGHSLYRRGVPGPAAAQPDPLCLPGRHGY